MGEVSTVALSNQQTDLAGKRLALLREVVPGLRRLAIMVNVDLPAAVLEMGEIQAAAGTLGLDVATFEIRRAEDIAPAFEALKGRAEALYGSRAVSARMLIRTRWMITSVLRILALRKITIKVDPAFATLTINVPPSRLTATLDDGHALRASSIACWVSQDGR
jgi:ABC-type uncharacterized transport system substrate-binding protein